MPEKITKVVGIVFALFWLVFTFLEYWQYHEETRRSIQLFQFSGLAIVLLLLGVVLVFVLLRFRDRPAMKYLQNGLGLTLLMCLLAVLCMNAFFHKNLGTFLTPGEDIKLIGTLLSTGLSTYLVMLVCYATGSLIGQLFPIRVQNPGLPLVYLAIGIMFIVSLLFVLGIFGLLNGLLLWPLFLLLLSLSWRSAWKFIRITFWDPLPAINSANAVGLSLFYLFFVLISMNFVQVARPFPTGFDAMTYYVNISSLIRDYHALVQGYGAYNWSLFMSLGYLLFDQTSVTLMLSFVGTVLSLIVLYQLSRKFLDVNYSILVILLFYSMPMSGWLSYRDMKVDMGLLFYSLLIILLVYDWLQGTPAPKAPEPEAVITTGRKKKKKAPTPDTPKELEAIRQWIRERTPVILNENARIVLIGIFTGFAVGIKFSAVIILLALIPGLAYAKGSRLAFAAALSLILAAVLIARFDAQAALRSLHLWADLIQWLLVLAGLGLLTYVFLREKETFFRVLKLSLVCILFTGLTLSPWLIKNAWESKSFSVSSLTSGEPIGPRPSVQDIQRAYENQKNGQ